MKGIGALLLLVVFVFSLASIDAKMINCKNDRECFLEFAENCERAQLTEKTEIWLFGFIINSENIMKIRGKDSGNCVLYMRNKKIGAKLDREFFEELSGGEIDDKLFSRFERHVNGMIKRAQGRDMICKFKSSEDLTNYLDSEILFEDELPDCVGALANGLNDFEFVGPV